MSITTAAAAEKRVEDFMRSITAERGKVRTSNSNEMTLIIGDVDFVRLGQRYSMSAVYAPDYDSQQISATLYRVNNNIDFDNISKMITTLVSVSYANDSLAADIINMTIVADRNKSIEDDRVAAIDIIKTQIESAVHEH